MRKLSIVTFSISLLAGALSSQVWAQSQYQRGYNDDSVVVFEDCDFRGKAVRLSPGDYRSIRATGLGNDKMSSIRVPRGMDVVIFEDDDFRGAYARIDQDIRCFDRRWDNEVSSVQIRESGYDNRGRGRYDDSRNSRNDSRYGSRNDSYNNRGYDGRDYDNQRRDNRRNGGARNDRRNDSNVSAKNISQVVFDGVVLQQTSKKQWRMNSRRGGVSQYKEVRRDQDSVYLENQYTAERVRIDLFANDVTFVNRNGRQQRYAIDRKQAAVASTPTQTERPNRPNNAQNLLIRGACFNYRAYTKGGSGGVRFHGKDGFYRFGKKAHKGKICHQGPLTMEINKENPNTNVIVEIQGKTFRFAANEKHDVYLNNWYRKKITLRVKK